MIRKILIGILIVLGLAVAVINQLILGIIAVGVWIYLFIAVRKQKNIALHGEMESRISESHLKRIKAFLIIAAFSFLVFVANRSKKYFYQWASYAFCFCSLLMLQIYFYRIDFLANNLREIIK